jgi:DNA repair exonuclease SbcCD ATPase subunit
MDLRLQFFATYLTNPSSDDGFFHFPIRPSMCLISGVTGAGKSTLFEAIRWCLYGTLRGIHPLNGPSTAKTHVEIRFVWREYLLTITRLRNPSHFELRYVKTKVVQTSNDDDDDDVEMISVPSSSADHEPAVILENDIAQEWINKNFYEEKKWMICSYVPQNLRHLFLQCSADVQWEMLRLLAGVTENVDEFKQRAKDNHVQAERKASDLQLSMTNESKNIEEWKSLYLEHYAKCNSYNREDVRVVVYKLLIDNNDDNDNDNDIQKMIDTLSSKSKEAINNVTNTLTAIEQRHNLKRSERTCCETTIQSLEVREKLLMDRMRDNTYDVHRLSVLDGQMVDLQKTRADATTNLLRLRTRTNVLVEELTHVVAFETVMQNTDDDKTSSCTWSRQNIVDEIRRRNDLNALQRQFAKQIHSVELVEKLRPFMSETTKTTTAIAQCLSETEQQVRNNKSLMHDLRASSAIDTSKLASEWENHCKATVKYDSLGGPEAAQQQLQTTIDELKEEIQTLRQKINAEEERQKILSTLYECPCCKHKLKWDNERRVLLDASSEIVVAVHAEDDDENDSDMKDDLQQYTKMLTQYTEGLVRCQKEIGVRERLLAQAGLQPQQQTTTVVLTPLMKERLDVLVRGQQEYNALERTTDELQRAVQLLQTAMNNIVTITTPSSVSKMSDAILQQWLSLSTKSWTFSTSANATTSAKVKEEIEDIRSQIADVEREFASVELVEKEHRSLKQQAERYEDARTQVDSVGTALRNETLRLVQMETCCEIDAMVANVRAQLSFCADLERAVSIQRKILEQEDRVAQLVTEQASHVERAKRLDRLRKIMDSVESSLLTACVKHLNSIMTMVLPYLFDQPISTHLELSKIAKTTQRVSHRVNFQIMYRSDKDRAIETLSGGESDRISIVMSLAFASMTSFPFLFVDEAFTSLDIETRDRCIAALRHAANNMGKCIVLVCHDSLEGLFDHVIHVHPQIQ